LEAARGAYLLLPFSILGLAIAARSRERSRAALRGHDWFLASGESWVIAPARIPSSSLGRDGAELRVAKQLVYEKVSRESMMEPAASAAVACAAAAAGVAPLLLTAAKQSRNREQSTAELATLAAVDALRTRRSASRNRAVQFVELLICFFCASLGSRDRARRGTTRPIAVGFAASPEAASSDNCRRASAKL
jgi:hypothetical protein